MDSPAPSAVSTKSFQVPGAVARLHRRARFQLPEPLKTPSVSGQQCVRLDNLQGLLPIGNKACQQQQRQPLPPRQPWRFRAPAEDINCCRNRAFSASSSARLRGRSANVPVTRFGRAGSVRQRKSWLAADERRAHRFLAHCVSWLNMAVYAREGRRFLGAGRVYHGQLTTQIRPDERGSQHSTCVRLN